MKILLFGISNVGKSTIGKQLSRKLGYDFDDLDEEIKRQYGKIDNFKSEYPFDYERHRKRGEILKEIIDKYDDNVVIAVSVINYSRFINGIIKNKEILAIEFLKVTSETWVRDRVYDKIIYKQVFTILKIYDILYMKNGGVENAKYLCCN